MRTFVIVFFLMFLAGGLVGCGSDPSFIDRKAPTHIMYHGNPGHDGPGGKH